jgi:RNA polymerase sigma factor (sigma-70 family)
MPVSGSVSQWIDRLKAGDESAADHLWRRYYRRLLGLAHKKLGDAPRRVVDEEDVVVKAFQSLFEGARQGRFPDLHDRHDLWHLILRITERKAYDQLRAQTRKKRGSGLVGGESALADRERASAGASRGGEGINQVADPEPTPAMAAEMIESFDRLLGLLDDDQQRQIALSKLEGYSNREIAGRIGCSVPTVERRLRLIRDIWTLESGS